MDKYKQPFSEYDNSKENEKEIVKYSKILAGYFSMVGVKPDKIDDLVQEVLLKVVNAKSPYTGKNDAELKTWLIAIARNTHFDQGRRANAVSYPDRDSRRTGGSEELNMVLDKSSFEKELTNKDFVQKLIAQTLKSASPDSSRDNLKLGIELFMMLKVDGYTVEEISKLTGLNENTIKVKTFRAKQQLVKAAKKLKYDDLINS